MAPETAKRRKLNALESLPLSAHADEMLLDDSDRDRDGSEDSPADEEKPAKSKDTQAVKKSAPKSRTEGISGNMYESSALKMQVEEMLAGVRLDAEKRLGSVEQALHKLKGLIEAIKDRPLVAVGDVLPIPKNQLLTGYTNRQLKVLENFENPTRFLSRTLARSLTRTPTTRWRMLPRRVSMSREVLSIELRLRLIYALPRI